MIPIKDILQDFKMVKQVLIEPHWMFYRTRKQGK